MPSIAPRLPSPNAIADQIWIVDQPDPMAPVQIWFKPPIGLILLISSGFLPLSQRTKRELLFMINPSSKVHFRPFKLRWIQNEEISAMRIFSRAAYDFCFPLIYKGFVPFGTFYLLYEVF